MLGNGHLDFMRYICIGFRLNMRLLPWQPCRASAPLSRRSAPNRASPRRIGNPYRHQIQHCAVSPDHRVRTICLLQPRSTHSWKIEELHAPSGVDRGLTTGPLSGRCVCCWHRRKCPRKHHLQRRAYDLHTKQLLSRPKSLQA